MMKNQLKAGVLLSYIAQGLQILITLFYTPVMLRMMGQSEYGIYQLAFSTVNILSLMNLGFSSSYIKFYAKASQQDNPKKARADLNGTYAIVFIILSASVLIFGSVIAYNTDSLLGGKLTQAELHTAKAVMYILVLNCALHFVNVLPVNYITATEHFIAGRVIHLGGVIMNPCISFPLLCLGYGAVSLSLALLFITLIQLILNTVFCIRRLHINFSFSNLQWGLFKSIAVFSFWIFLESVITMLNNNVDSILLGKLVGSVSITIYRVGFSIVTLFMTLSISISSVFSPRINRMVEQHAPKSTFDNLFIRVGRVQFIVLYLFVLGFAFFGRRFFKIWVGEGYDVSFYIVMILISTKIIDLIQSIGYEIQRAKGMQKYRDYLWGGVAVSNVIVSIFFIKNWGAVGAALGTALAVIVGSGIFMNWFYATKVQLDVRTFWREIIKLATGGLLPIVFGLVLYGYIQKCPVMIYLLLLVIFSLLYVGSMYYIGLRKTDREEVVAYVKPLLRRNK